ncbi:EboA domain-containing protein [Actinomadura sp. 1N219]|uniref:EboA domain-containing protein n=1 Tax=Actinomadura sp. 1N219 TaxID=3375152 RepID=UPI0037965812
MEPEPIPDARTLDAILHRELPETAGRWLDAAVARCAADPTAITALFPVARRACGRAAVPRWPGWSIDQAVRVRLLLALALRGQALAARSCDLYDHGDSAERIAVLRGLASLDRHRGLGDAGLPLVRDALRTNDVRLIEAAMGPYAADHLDDAAYRQAVLKCAFAGLPLDRVPGLWRRADGGLGRMLDDLVRERHAAGRSIGPDVMAVAERLHDRSAVGRGPRGEH